MFNAQDREAQKAALARGSTGPIPTYSDSASLPDLQASAARIEDLARGLGKLDSMVPVSVNLFLTGIEFEVESLRKFVPKT
jgi:hypothetical protein